MATLLIHRCSVFGKAFAFVPFSKRAGCGLVVALLGFVGAPAQSAVWPSSQEALAEINAAAPLPAAESQLQADAEPVAEMNGHQVADTPRRFRYSFSVTTRGVYDDNINISSFDRVSDYYFTIEPVITLGLGTESEGVNSLSLVYRPSVFLFARNSYRDAGQHVIQLRGAHQFGHLTLTLLADIQLLDGQNLNSISDPTGRQANIDIGVPAKHQVYAATLGGSYDLTGKLFMSGAVTYSTDQYESLISSQNFSVNLFLNYIYSPKLTVGLGGTVGYNTTSDSGGTDQTFEQVNFRLNYAATAKINLSGSVGFERRQTGGETDNSSPVFDLTASYAPFDGTSVNLSAISRTQNSAILAGQDFSETTINFSLRQRFFQRVFVGLAIGYINSEYFSTIQNGSATRSDDYYYIEPTVDLNVTRYWTIGAYYLHRENSSTFAFFGFDNNQIGFHSTLTF